MRTLLALTLVIVCMTASVANTGPSVTTQVNTADGITTYVYTLTSNSADGIWSFVLFMPESAARVVTSFVCLGSASTANGHSFRGDWSSWSVGVDIAPYGTGTCVLTTPDSVPTSYTFTPPSYPSNWCWNSDLSNTGNSILPVPGVPEPSTLLVLLVGLGGVGGIIQRRRAH